MISIISVVILVRWAGEQRGYCTATGDFSHSDNMTVLYKMEPNVWKVLGKDGVEYNFKVCPTTPLELQAGEYIENADYEYRGCADFTSPLARLKIK